MKKVFLVSIILIFFVFVGCSSPDVSSSDISPSDLISPYLPSNSSINSINSNSDFYIWVDPDTCVNYIVYSNKSSIYAGVGGITPRYNSDGSLYISEVP